MWCSIRRTHYCTNCVRFPNSRELAYTLCFIRDSRSSLGYGLGKGFTDYPEDNKKVSEEELDEIRSTEDSLNVEKTVETEDASEKWYHFSKVQHLSGI